MIFDGLMFFEELDLLEVRLHELSGIVDRFIIAESDVTHSGKPKRMVFADNTSRFGEFLNRIIYVAVLDMPKGDDHWKRERHQRDAILRGLPRNASDDDTLIIGDADEIPRASAIASALPLAGTRTLVQRCYGGYINARCGDWAHATVAPVASYRTSSPSQLRQMRHFPVLDDAGWHFSSIGGADAICRKLEAYAHQEPEIQRHKNRDRIEANLKSGLGIWEWAGKELFENLNAGFPEWLVQNRERFKHLIRDDPDAKASRPTAPIEWSPSQNVVASQNAPPRIRHKRTNMVFSSKRRRFRGG